MPVSETYALAVELRRTTTLPRLAATFGNSSNSADEEFEHVEVYRHAEAGNAAAEDFERGGVAVDEAVRLAGLGGQQAKPGNGSRPLDEERGRGAEGAVLLDREDS